MTLSDMTIRRGIRACMENGALDPICSALIGQADQVISGKVVEPAEGCEIFNLELCTPVLDVTVTLLGFIDDLSDF